MGIKAVRSDFGAVAGWRANAILFSKIELAQWPARLETKVEPRKLSRGHRRLGDCHDVEDGATEAAGVQDVAAIRGSVLP